MDLQGNPIPPGARSTKVTTDPRAQQPIEEPSGPITNDSLAADSIRQGGAFSGNRGAEPMGVSGKQTTVNNNDTSAATTLPSVSAGGLREDRESQQKYPEALGGQGNFPGTHLSQSGYTGGSTAAKHDQGINAGEYSTASGSGRSQYNAGQAPSYVNDVTGDIQHPKPDGRNIREGGSHSNDAKNASFNSEIGSSQDPGREAVNQFQRNNARTDYSGRADEKQVNAQTPYEHLESNQRA
ncbi:uncharacterized protein N7529_011774 [Penicillium soppii]|uniref:uncharacterized protein n=1 Tax=Penicillium soppii TaxID=69789 RepID=UPI002546FB52|nr:uncharacterized protein N7529_011774 [Penicillium soppii]KAJ5852389.1 hypothetical protein N7529_011774 [Penicillium soppii]